MVDWESVIGEIILEKDPEYARAVDIASDMRLLVKSIRHYFTEFSPHKGDWLIDGVIVDAAAIQNFFSLHKQGLFELVDEAYAVFNKLNSAGEPVRAELAAHFADELREYATTVKSLDGSFDILAFGVVTRDFSRKCKGVSSLEKAVNHYLTS